MVVIRALAREKLKWCAMSSRLEKERNEVGGGDGSFGKGEMREWNADKVGTMVLVSEGERL